jgi:hypothetical protein
MSSLRLIHWPFWAKSNLVRWYLERDGLAGLNIPGSDMGWTGPSWDIFSWTFQVFPTRLLTSEDEYKWFWHQMIYFPGTINIVSTQLYYHDYIHRYSSLYIFQLCTSLTLCMLAFWSCEGVVFLVQSSSSHFTAGHVFPLPLSGANWRSLSPLWGSGPPLPKMAPLSTGSAHTPSPGSNTPRMLYPSFNLYWAFEDLKQATLATCQFTFYYLLL